VIPLAVREQLGIEPGQKLQVLAYEHRIEFLPIETAQAMRGFLPGLDTDVPREGDRV
jgi:bifunctional DNA-binding transcriptional regulator/antitoxin component of YhaV-PrlF toxin-antitoxin module